MKPRGRNKCTIDDELAALEAAEKAATPEPWETRPGHSGTVTIVGSGATRGDPAGFTIIVDDAYFNPQDVPMVTDARNALPRLIREVRLLREVLMRSRPSNASASACRVHALRPDRKLGEP